MRFLHVSDIHLLDLSGVGVLRYANKRATGALNLLTRRGRLHDGHIFDALLGSLEALTVDRLVVTGDLTNLSLEPEFELVRRKLAAARVPVTVIPGNHDTYTAGSYRKRRFEQYLSGFMQGERIDGHAYPFVQRSDGVALIGTSSAIATPPLFATGRLGRGQITRLDRILMELGEENVARVVLVHHPILEGAAKLHHRLLDAHALTAVLAHRGAELVLHGHEHKLMEGTIPSTHAPIPVHGISSGTAVSRVVPYRACASLYEFDRGVFRRDLLSWDGAAFTSAAPRVA